MSDASTESFDWKAAWYALDQDARSLAAERDALQAQLAERDRALAEWAEVSQRNYQRAIEAEERLAEARAGLRYADETFRDLGWHSKWEVTSATLAKIDPKP
jgi:chromosome segregation ATPase